MYWEFILKFLELSVFLSISPYLGSTFLNFEIEKKLLFSNYIYTLGYTEKKDSSKNGVIKISTAEVSKHILKNKQTYKKKSIKTLRDKVEFIER